jgi:hypothetical protein
VDDVTSGTAEATIISNLTQVRNNLQLSGYQCVMDALAPISTWDAGQLTKMANINSAMAALDTRRYGNFVPLPSELSDPNNLTYFYPDGIHYTKAGFDVLYALVRPYVDSYYTRNVTTLKGHWPLNGDLLDDSGYDRDLVAIGSPTYTTGLGGAQCLVTSPTGNFARAPAPYRNYDHLPLTLVAWFQGKAAADDYIAYKLSFSGGTKNWGIQRHNFTSQIRFSMTDLTAEVRATDKTYSINTWYGVAFILDSVNGGRLYTTDAGGDPATFALRDTKPWASTPSVPNASSGVGALRIGCYGGDTGATSTWIQNVKIYFEELTLAQLQALSPIT